MLLMHDALHAWWLVRALGSRLPGQPALLALARARMFARWSPGFLTRSLHHFQQVRVAVAVARMATFSFLPPGSEAEQPEQRAASSGKRQANSAQHLTYIILLGGYRRELSLHATAIFIAVVPPSLPSSLFIFDLVFFCFGFPFVPQLCSSVLSGSVRLCVYAP